ncbi:EamA family transporter [Kocuria rosea]|uniref:EamA family transporter n=1 Tax=Kocuria rosea TaxID=1275 RepID=UPI000D65A4BD|nr:EamA family transporter [Kocuria rosea]PWF83550.1 EamA family transporter [Kocuria rosea]QCY31866.1 EamA family transporter [Kocuria rosea]TQN39314.1 inner membrane transporter RhtA [Kocuria rosea]STX06894.1 Inner membrane transporter rhtA [Kocuria rosea]
MTTLAPARGPRLRPTLYVLAAVVSVQFGGALAAVLVPLIGASATVTMRLLISAAIMLAVIRPRLRGRSREAWRSGLFFGAALAGMNFAFYQSLATLPLGVAVTIEFLGPLALSAVLSRRGRDVLAVAAALGGIVLISQALTVPWAELDLAGIAWAALAGAGWAAYILGSRSAGRHFDQLDGLAVALVVAAVLVTPVGVLTAHVPALTWGVLGAGVGIAMLSSVVPYSLELLALRAIPPKVFGILLSLEPAVAALAGLLVLGQALTGPQLVGMGLVVAASAVIMVGGSSPELAADAAADPAADPAAREN